MLNNALVRLRAMELEDAALVKSWRFDMANYDYFYEFTPSSTLAHRAWLERALVNPREINFIAEDAQTGRPFGMISLVDIDGRNRHCEMGRVLVGDTDYRGKGFGKAMIELACEYAFKHLNMHKIYCEVFSSNARAAKTYENSGFAPAGERKEHIYKNGAFQDVTLLEKFNDFA